MLNHFMKFDGEASALTALAAYAPDGAWDRSLVLPGQRVVLARASWDMTDPDAPVLVTPEQVMPGFFVTISLPAIDTALRDMEGNACRLIGDSGTGAIVYTAPDLDEGLLATAIIEPVPAGAAYFAVST